MNKMFRAVSVALMVALCACSQQAQTPAQQLSSGLPGAQASGAALAPAVQALRKSDAIADGPDRGSLVNYDRRAQPLKQGAYTSHLVQVSEDHAIRAIVTRNLILPAPDGEYLKLTYQRHAESTNGNWTWIGRLAGSDTAREAIITFGEKAVFGSIPQGGGRPDLKLTTRAGKLWMVETDPRQAPVTDRREQDTLVPMAAARRQLAVASAAAPSMSAASTSAALPKAAASNTIDVVLGYTNGFATRFGGQSQAVTRLTFMVEVNNQAFVNSQIDGAVRLVGTQQVNYTDSGTNKSALVDLTGHSGTGSTTVPASLLPLRAARDQFGADLVALVRAYEFANEGCGIAWLLGANQQAIVPSEDQAFGYAVVSNLPDGQSVPGTGDKRYFCAPETLAHELGHLMGSAHDSENAKNDAGALQYGRYAYSFGAKTDPTRGNFYTIMSYGDDGQTAYRVFSNPNVTICGGLACGVANQTDNARSLNQTIPVVAGFRAAVVPISGSVRNDFNGDGLSDLFWRNGSSGENQIWRAANSATFQIITPLGQDWLLAGTGDFDGDGTADLLWRNKVSGANSYWRSGSVGAGQVLTALSSQAWQVAGIGDFNADGRSDIFWRNSTSGANSIWFSGNVATGEVLAAVPGDVWRVAGIGDFDGDEQADILWRNASSGANVIWRSGNFAASQALASVPDQAWTIAGVGDFNGDRRADILWRHLNRGENTIWRSGDFSSSQSVSPVTSQAWRIATIGDFNGDRSFDIVWRNIVTGENSIWRSGNSANGQFVSTVPVGPWSMQPSP